MSGIPGRGGRKRLATDAQILAAFDQVYSEHRWPNVKNIGLKIQGSRLITLRYGWAMARGIKLMTADEANRFNRRSLTIIEAKPQPKPDRQSKRVDYSKPLLRGLAPEPNTNSVQVSTKLVQEPKSKRPRTEWARVKRILDGLDLRTIEGAAKRMEGR